MKEIYDMKLHENMILVENKHLIETIRRVPGGWIYNIVMSGKMCTSTFVPWHDSGRLIKGNGNYEELNAKLKNTEQALGKAEQALSKINLCNLQFDKNKETLESKKIYDIITEYSESKK